MSAEFTRYAVESSANSYTDPSTDVDPFFVFDFRACDDPDDGQRWTTWLDVEALCRGPEPRPDWGRHQPGRRRHGAGNPQDRQGSRRLSARTRGAR